MKIPRDMAFAPTAYHTSVSNARFWSADIPVGDPFGGPAYGKREFIGIALSAFGAFSGWTALAAGGLTTLGTIAAGAALVGGAMTVIGGLTGDADLMKIGGIIGMVGGAAGFLDGGVIGTIGDEFGKMFGGGEAASGLDSMVSSAAESANMDAMMGNGITTTTGGLPETSVAAPPAGAMSIPGTAAGPASTSGGMLNSVQGESAFSGIADAQMASNAAAGGLQVAENATGSITADTSLTPLNEWKGADYNIGGKLGADTANQGLSTNTTAGPELNANSGDGGLLGGLLGKNGFISQNAELLKIFGSGLGNLGQSDQRKANELLARAKAGETAASEELLRMKTKMLQDQQNNAQYISPVFSNSVSINPGGGQRVAGAYNGMLNTARP